MSRVELLVVYHHEQESPQVNNIIDLFMFCTQVVVNAVTLIVSCCIGIHASLLVCVASD